MNALARLVGRLTLPYRRGAEYLSIALGEAGDEAGETLVQPYNFNQYHARWGANPKDITYLLIPRRDVGADDVSVTVFYTPGDDKKVAMTIPRGTAAGTGLVVPLPGTISADLRLVAITVSPAPPGPGRQAWELTALLGNIAKMSWLLGSEKDAIARVGRDVKAARFCKTATGAGLDALGRDMRVARFPPRPHSLDVGTVALWHLDDRAGATVADETTRAKTDTTPPIPGHPGTVVDAIAGAPGKYGTGYNFPGTDGATIVVAQHVDFDITETGDATIEAFVHVTMSGPTPRAIIARRDAESPGPSNTAGWSLCVMDGRGFVANVFFAICDGASAEVRLHGDLSLADGAFHHVAAVVDRTRKRVRLFIDGVQRDSASIEKLKAVAPPATVNIGSTVTGNAFGGTVDEVRVSRIARTTFHPVLGEDDDAYRARLTLFRRWMLPTPANILAMINEAAPLLDDHQQHYDLIETNQPTHTVHVPVRIVPDILPRGQAISIDGSAVGDESVAGTPDDDIGFDPVIDLVALTPTTDPKIDALGDPGKGRMQAGAARLLRALAAAVGGGKIVLERSFDPAGPTPLHSVGRALRLRHTTLAPEKLGPLAHRIGFPYVRNLGSDLAVAVGPGERLAITGIPGPRVDGGKIFELGIDPPPPAGGSVTWTIITPGPARAKFIESAGDAAANLPPAVATRRKLRLVTETPGDLAVRVEYSLRGRTRSGTFALRVDPVSVEAGHAIDAAGNFDPDFLAIAGVADAGFSPAYLVEHPAVPNVNFATADSARMQVATRDALDALVALLKARETPGVLTVAAAYLPGEAGVEVVGRRVLLKHSTLDQTVLAALAARSFDYVLNGADGVAAYVRPDTWLGIRLADGSELPTTVVVDKPLDIATNAALPAGSYNWNIRAIGKGEAGFDGARKFQTSFRPTQSGLVVLALTYVADDPARAPPYSFEIRLKPALDTEATTIPKSQYDIIMNVLDAFHPIGVEVKTDRLRPRVREIESDPSKAFPSYSFPNFRF